VFCNACEHNPCACASQLAPVMALPLWLVQHCSTQGCSSRIRVPAATPLAHPLCRWCDQGVSHAKRPTPAPAGMPDPELPWPWMTEADREHKIHTAYWQARFRQHHALYAQWLTVRPLRHPEAHEPTEVQA